MAYLPAFTVSDAVNASGFYSDPVCRNYNVAIGDEGNLYVGDIL
jgi:hypothetical protein